MVRLALHWIWEAKVRDSRLDALGFEFPGRDNMPGATFWDGVQPFEHWIFPLFHKVGPKEDLDLVGVF